MTRFTIPRCQQDRTWDSRASRPTPIILSTPKFKREPNPGWSRQWLRCGPITTRHNVCLGGLSWEPSWTHHILRSSLSTIAILCSLCEVAHDYQRTPQRTLNLKIALLSIHPSLLLCSSTHKIHNALFDIARPCKLSILSPDRFCCSRSVANFWPVHSACQKTTVRAECRRLGRLGQERA